MTEARISTPIVLAGMPGVGKSWVGRALAKRLGGTFLDTDRVIEQQAGRRVREIFAQDGEDAFREMETVALRSALAADVVALGGGVPVVEANRLLLLERGAWVVQLVAAPETVRTWLAHDHSRPLLAEGFDAWLRLRDERAPLYAEISDYTVNVDGRPIGHIVAEIVRAATARGIIAKVES